MKNNVPLGKLPVNLLATVEAFYYYGFGSVRLSGDLEDLITLEFENSTLSYSSVVRTGFILITLHV